MVFFASRSDSIKQKVVRALNAAAITPETAWEQFAANIRNRAHQYREDVDSGAEAAGFIDVDGQMTELGFRFLNACERTRSANNPQPIAILRRALLVEGDLLAFLHYVHSISDQAFRRDELRFVDRDQMRFQSFEYRVHLLDELSETLQVAARSRRRPGRQRPPLEGEFITLRHLGLVGNFRIGIGLEINWPAVYGAIEMGLS